MALTSSVRRAAICWFMACIATASGSALADELLASVDSPDKTLTVSLQLADDGRLSYQVAPKGTVLISPSRLGFVLTNDAPLDAGFVLRQKLVSEHDDTWEQPWGERRLVRDHYRQMQVDQTR